MRTFLWQALHDALATAMAMHRRIPNIPSTCPRCGAEQEDLIHLFFLCASSRATWFLSPLTLRVDQISLDFGKALIQITITLNSENITLACNLLCCVWKARNMEVLKGKRMEPQEVVRQAIMMPTHLELSQHGIIRQPQHEVAAICLEGQVYCVLADGSWDMQCRGGLAVMVFDPGGDLQRVTAKPVQAVDAFHAEDQAVLTALLVAEEKITYEPHAVFYIITDCRVLAHCINTAQMEDVPTWKTLEQVVPGTNMKEKLVSQVRSQQVPRVALNIPHKLANLARTTNFSFEGKPTVQQCTSLGIQPTVDKRFFTAG